MKLTPQYNFTIDHGDILNADPRWRWDSSGYSDNSFILWLVTGGKGTLRAGQDSYNLQSGDCIISPLSQPHHGAHDPHDRLVIYWFIFYYISKAGAVIVPEPLPRPYRRIGGFGFMRELMQRALHAAHSGSESEACAWLNTVFLEIARHDAEASMGGVEQEQFRAIQAIAEKIKQDPHKEWDLTGLSRQLDITRDHFIRLFHRFLGVTPREFVIQCRIESACNLLRFSGLSISEISDELGFCDVHYFSRQFAGRMGISPSAFRKQGSSSCRTIL